MLFQLIVIFYDINLIHLIYPSRRKKHTINCIIHSVYIQAQKITQSEAMPNDPGN